MSTFRNITISLVIATAALAPATAIARNGADDDPALNDDRGGQQAGTATTPAADDNPTAGDDDGATRAQSPKRARRERRVTGDCTGDSTSKLKVKLRDGRWETEFEVDQNRVGVAWDVSLSRNANVVVATTKTTRAPSGSFALERRLRNAAGRDTISAKATSPSGEVCSAAITI
jgi:hypothetical protein